jgi:hypothetical protein
MSQRLPPTTVSGASIQGASAPGSVVVRLGWMLGGTLAMMVSLMVIAGKPRLTVGLPDAIFWAAVVLTGLLRTLDITRFHGETTQGVPATTRDLKRYLAGLGALAVAGWLVAQSIHV